MVEMVKEIVLRLSRHCHHCYPLLYLHPILPYPPPPPSPILTHQAILPYPPPPPPNTYPSSDTSIRPHTYPSPNTSILPHTNPSPDTFVSPQTYTSPSIPLQTYTSLPYPVSQEPSSMAIDITLSSTLYHPLHCLPSMRPMRPWLTLYQSWVYFQLGDLVLHIHVE